MGVKTVFVIYLFFKKYGFTNLQINKNLDVGM